MLGFKILVAKIVSLLNKNTRDSVRRAAEVFQDSYKNNGILGVNAQFMNAVQRYLKLKAKNISHLRILEQNHVFFTTQLVVAIFCCNVCLLTISMIIQQLCNFIPECLRCCCSFMK